MVILSVIKKTIQKIAMLQGVMLLGMMLLGMLAYAPAGFAIVSAQQVAVVVNTQDANSQLIADYYKNKRGIPESNIIKISLPHKNRISAEQFAAVYQQIKKQTPAAVQFYALAWSKPFRVGCMSITSAFAFGFDKAYCAKGCVATRFSPYYNSDSVLPKDELGITPTMMLAGSSLNNIKAMIDRGVAADKTNPQATAYLMSTSDKARNRRAWRYPVIKKILSQRINIALTENDVLKNKNDVMFYFTGLTHVKEIQSNQFLPGAIADHLTSTGGQLFGSKQMSILRWLDAGATASFGAVVEPCSFTQKFPNPGIVIERYLNGESLIEAYWKSVAWPGQGVFVGEPMAAPYTVN